MFPADLRHTTAAHLQRLIDDKVPESALLELKRGPPGKGDAQWHAGQQLPEASRNQLLAHVVAFANAEGGHLVLGIDEAEGGSRVATALSPLPRIMLLAETIRNQIRDLIEPQLLHVEVHPVASSDGAADGFLVIRVAPSARAPHRVSSTRLITTRRANGTEPMTMREAQDLTLQRARSTTDRQAMLYAGSESFRRAVLQTSAETDVVAVGIRVAALPVIEQLALPKLPLDYAGIPFAEDLQVRLRAEGQQPVLRLLQWPQIGWERRRIVRGVAARARGTADPVTMSADQSGWVDFTIIASERRDWAVDTVRLYPDWILAIVGNAMLTAHHLRMEAQAPTAEYAVLIEAHMYGRELEVTPFSWAKGAVENAYRVGGNSLSLPLYELGSFYRVGDLVTQVATDLYHAGNMDFTADLELVVPNRLAFIWAGS